MFTYNQKIRSSSNSYRRFWGLPVSWTPVVYINFTFSFSSSSIKIFFLSRTFFNLKKSSLACSSNSCSIYLEISMNLGMTICYKALTRRFVTLIFSSKVTKEAYIKILLLEEMLLRSRLLERF